MSVAAAGGVAEQFAGVLGELQRSGAHVDRHRAHHRRGAFYARQAAQGAQDCFHTAQDMRLGATQSAQAEQGQVLLQLPDVGLAQGQVVQQIACAVQMRRVDLLQRCRVGLLHGERLLDQALDGRNDVLLDVSTREGHGGEGNGGMPPL